MLFHLLKSCWCCSILCDLGVLLRFCWYFIFLLHILPERIVYMMRLSVHVCIMCSTCVYYAVTQKLCADSHELLWASDYNNTELNIVSTNVLTFLLLTLLLYSFAVCHCHRHSVFPINVANDTKRYKTAVYFDAWCAYSAASSVDEESNVPRIKFLERSTLFSEWVDPVN